MSFVAAFDALPLAAWRERSLSTSQADVDASMRKAHPTLADFSRLISPAAGALLEPMCRRAQTLTQQRFGKVIRLFAPLYLSNECINNCKYCGF